MTNDPSVGKDARRIHVRRTVMTEYHKRQKLRRKQHEIVEEDSNPERNPCSLSSAVDTSQLSNHEQRRPICLFQPISWTDPGHIQTSQLIITFLRGQATKAAKDMSLVAFVHRRFKDAYESREIGEHPLILCQETLNNYGNIHKSATFQIGRFWEDVVFQQESIYTQSDTWSAWKLLSAAQTITLYLLLWIKEGTTDQVFPDGDIALLFTLGKIFKVLQAHHLHGKPSNFTLPLVDDWERWIFYESTMRTSMVYFLLTLVVSMEFGLNCDRPSDWHIEDLPLPALKASWVADDKETWRNSFDEALLLPQALTFGDLMNDRGADKYRIERWQEGSDELGLIVAIASHLPMTVT